MITIKCYNERRKRVVPSFSHEHGIPMTQKQNVCVCTNGRRRYVLPCVALFYVYDVRAVKCKMCKILGSGEWTYPTREY